MGTGYITVPTEKSQSLRYQVTPSDPEEGRWKKVKEYSRNPFVIRSLLRIHLRAHEVADDDWIVAIPSLSGHSFGWNNLERNYHLTQKGRNPFVIRSLLRIVSQGGG